MAAAVMRLISLTSSTGTGASSGGGAFASTCAFAYALAAAAPAEPPWNLSCASREPGSSAQREHSVISMDSMYASGRSFSPAMAW